MSVKSKVLEILGENPITPYSVMAIEVGVTRKRVCQIARQNGYPLRTDVLKLKTCPVFGKTFNTRNQYCSPACGYKARQIRVVVNCYQCGKSVERTPGNMRSKSGKYFCNKVCFGKWAGGNHSPKNKSSKPVAGNFEHEIGSIEEFSYKGSVLSPEVMGIYNALLNLKEKELIKVKNSKKEKLRNLDIAIKRKAKRHGGKVNSAIRDIEGDCLLFLMREDVINVKDHT